MTETHKRGRLILLGLFAVVGVTITGCTGSGTTTSTSSAAAPPAAVSTHAPSSVAAPLTPTLTAAQQNALAQAQQYLGTSAFSRTGLIKQLQFGGFALADATYGVDHSGADWNAEAVKSAKEYLATQPFSHSALVKQLEFSGFTPAEAEFGVHGAGL